jgi:hypothetical protein
MSSENFELVKMDFVIFNRTVLLAWMPLLLGSEEMIIRSYTATGTDATTSKVSGKNQLTEDA